MEINNKKTESVFEICNVEIKKLKNRIKQLTSSDWDTDEDFELNYNKKIVNSDNQNIAALGNTSHIIFRFVNKTDTTFEYLEGSRWQEWKAILLPIMQEATKYLNYTNRYFPKVMLAKLPKKTFIRPHADGTIKGVVPHKIHIPLETNDATFFFLEKNRYHFKEGVAYEVNNGRTHSVINNGETDRIHLIFECLNYDLQSKIIQKQIDNRLKGRL